MTLRRFVVLSVTLHIILLGIVYRMPLPEKKRQGESFTTTLVSPEFLIPPAMPQPRQVRPVPPRAPLSRMPRRIVPGAGAPYQSSPHPAEREDVGQPADTAMQRQKREVGPSGGKGAPAPKKAPEGPGLLDRYRLFDKGVTEEIARRGEEAGSGGGKKDDTVTFDTSEYRYIGYNRLLKGKIESIWVYPPEEAAAGHYGDLKIRFTIKKDGRLGEVELVRTSGYPALDRAAIKALRDGEPYWPLPDEWGRDTYTILGHFIYSPFGPYYVR